MVLFYFILFLKGMVQYVIAERKRCLMVTKQQIRDLWPQISVVSEQETNKCFEVVENKSSFVSIFGNYVIIITPFSLHLYSLFIN